MSHCKCLGVITLFLRIPGCINMDLSKSMYQLSYKRRSVISFFCAKQRFTWSDLNTQLGDAKAEDQNESESLLIVLHHSLR